MPNSNNFIRLKTFIEFQEEIVSTRVILSSELLITLTAIENSGIIISSKLKIEQDLNQAILLLNASLIPSNQNFLMVEPSILSKEYFTLDGKMMITEFFNSKIKIINQDYTNNLDKTSEVGKVMSSRSNEIEGAGAIIGFIPLQQSITFIRFMQTI